MKTQETGMATAFPAIGTWFRRPNGMLLDVVDGALEVTDAGAGLLRGAGDGGHDLLLALDAWREQLLVEVPAPEDWSGSVDMDPDDYIESKNEEMPRGFHDPLSFLDES